MADDLDPKTSPIPVEQRHRMEVQQPKLSAKWSKATAIPDNTFLPADAEVELIGEAEYPISRPAAAITIARHDQPTSTVATVAGLQLDNKKIVDAKSATPKRKFSFDDGIYETWNQLDYDFTVTVDNTSATTTSTLKVKRWHVHAVDVSDTRPSFPEMRASEKANHLAAFASATTNDQLQSWSFPASTAAKGDFGGAMKSSYSFNYTGHGAVMCGVCGAMFDCITTEGSDFGTWTHCSTDATHDDPISTHCVGAAPYFQGSDVANQGTVPTTPKYLMFSVCCGGGFEPSLYQAYLDRGTRYAIGFRKSTMCTWARDYAKDFFTQWVGDYQCDPDKIPTVYGNLYVQWKVKLEPRIFGADEPSGLWTDIKLLVQRIVDLF